MIVQTQAVGRIVVGTDGSQRSEKAVTWAAERAVARKLPLLVLFVVPEPSSAALNMVPDTTDQERQRREEAKLTLNAVVDQVRAAHPDLSVNGVVVEGNPAFVLAEWSKDAELVVVGARGQTAPLSVRLLGGVSDAVVAHGRGPIAIVSDDAVDNPGGPVVLGVDDSAEARAAARLAFEAAEVRGVPVVAIHAYEHGPRESPSDSAVWTQAVASFKEDLRMSVEDILAEVRDAHPHVPVEIRAVRARPQDALVEASQEAGLVVVGSRGRGGFAGLLLGSTSKHILREAHSPVIVTRGQGAAGEEP